MLIQRKLGKEIDFNQNIIKNGSVNWKNVLGFILYSLSMFLIQNVIAVNMYFSKLAGINAGVMSIIWRFNVPLTALGDFLIYGQ